MWRRGFHWHKVCWREWRKRKQKVTSQNSTRFVWKVSIKKKKKKINGHLQICLLNSYMFRPKLDNCICVGLQTVGHSNAPPPPEIKKKKHLNLPFLSGTHKFALFGSRAQEGLTSSLPILIEMRTWRSGKWAALMWKLKTSITHPFSVSSEVEIRNITYTVSTFTSFTESSSCFCKSFKLLLE